MFAAYILYSSKHNKIYIGSTSSLIHRFYSHNIYGTKDWTRSYRPWIMIYCNYHETKQSALQQEKTLKMGKGRELIWGKIDEHLQDKGYIDLD